MSKAITRVKITNCENRENMLSMHLWFSVIKCGRVVTISFKPLPFWLPHCDDCTLQLWARTDPFSHKLPLSGIFHHSSWRVTMACSKVHTLDISRPEETNLTMVWWLVCGTPPIVQGFEYLVPGRLWTFENMKSCGIKWVTLGQPCEVAQPGLTSYLLSILGLETQYNHIPATMLFCHDEL